MIGSLGFKVNTITPNNYASNVNVNTKVVMQMTSEVDKISLSKAFTVYEDTRNIYVKEGTFNPALYRKVLGKFESEGRTITFTPDFPFKDSIRYIVRIDHKEAYDILNRGMHSDYISVFETENFATLPPCEILYPTTNEIIRSFNNIKLTDLGEKAKSYVVQISRSAEFNNVIYDKVGYSTEFSDFNYGDGLYFIRARATNGEFGETVVITVRTREKTTATDQDDDEGFIYIPVDEDEDEAFVISHIPDGDEVGPNINILYTTFRGEIKDEDVDFYEFSVNGKAIDSSDENYGEVDGSVVKIYNPSEDITYVIFSPINKGGE